MATPIVVRELVAPDSVTLLALQDDEQLGSGVLQWQPTGYPRILEFTPHVPLMSIVDPGAEETLLGYAEDLVYERGHKLLQLLVPPWEAWTPEQVTQLLSGCTVPWCVAAGWAIELHLGRSARPHSDLEIAIPRESFDGLAAYLRDFDLHVVGDHQTWVCEQGKWRMDIFLEPGDETTWISHRDDRVRVPLAEAIAHTADGIPYLRPELVLFTKAKHARPKDEADLLATVPTLDSRARGWLAEQIRLVYPGHAWLDRV